MGGLYGEGRYRHLLTPGMSGTAEMAAEAGVALWKAVWWQAGPVLGSTAPCWAFKRLFIFRAGDETPLSAFTTDAASLVKPCPAWPQAALGMPASTGASSSGHI